MLITLDALVLLFYTDNSSTTTRVVLTHYLRTQAPFPRASLASPATGPVLPAAPRERDSGGVPRKRPTEAATSSFAGGPG